MKTMYKNHIPPYAIEWKHNNKTVTIGKDIGEILRHVTGFEDSALHRGIGSFANHREKNDANAKFAITLMSTYIWEETIKQKKFENIKWPAYCLALVAVKNIYPGEEIFVDYNYSDNTEKSIKELHDAVSFTTETYNKKKMDNF
jgi:hypothetical protein